VRESREEKRNSLKPQYPKREREKTKQNRGEKTKAEKTKAKVWCLELELSSTHQENRQK